MAPPAQAKSPARFLDHAGGRLLDLPEKAKKGKKGKKEGKKRKKKKKKERKKITPMWKALRWTYEVEGITTRGADGVVDILLFI